MFGAKKEIQSEIHDDDDDTRPTLRIFSHRNRLKEDVEKHRWRVAKKINV